MITEVSVESYQSLKAVNVDLGPLTVFVGESNKGKSALIRALQALSFNESGNSFIHKDDPHTEVSVTLDNGHTVTWLKGKTGAYFIDAGTEGERQFTKLGQSVPEEISDALGIRRIEVDQTRLTPQFAGQFDAPFLLRESGGKAARVLAKLTCLDLVLTSTANCSKDLKRAKQKAADLEDHLEEKQAELEQFVGLDERQAKIDKLLEQAKELQGYVEYLDECNSRLRLLREAREALEKQPAVTESQLDKALEKLNWLQQCQDKLHERDAARDQVRRLDAEITMWAEKFTALESELGAYDVCPTCGQPVLKGEHDAV